MRNEDEEMNDAISMTAAIPWGIVIALVSFIAGFLVAAQNCPKP
jgi:Ni/Fe-hydrogenase subunit HybB-like protein